MKNTMLLAGAFALICFAHTLEYRWDVAPQQTQEQVEDCIADSYIDPTTPAELIELEATCGEVYVSWLD